MSDEAITFNGIDGTTGKYLLSLTPAEVVALARGEPVDPRHRDELRERKQRETEKVFGARYGVDVNNLAEAGWGIIFPADSDPAIETALSELIEHRRTQAAKTREGRFKILRGSDGYRQGQSWPEFLTSHDVEPGQADPDQLPYYLLLVGEPTQIPFSFQYQIDVQRAVGRIAFDTPQDYKQYANSVVAAEKGAPQPRTAAFIGVQNADDAPTELAATRLVAPLAKTIGKESPDWKKGIQTVIGAGATKDQFRSHLSGPEPPTFLFTASQGMALPRDHPRRLADQGALVCQDWPGPKAWGERGEIPQDFYFAAADVADDASLLGRMTFHFACYGAGTPSLNDYIHRDRSEPLEIAGQPFMAALPRRLLGHPAGGALAAIGHVERTWGYSITWGDDPQLNAYVDAVQMLLDGQPVGAAMEAFGAKYADLAANLAEEWKQAIYNKAIDDRYVSLLWTASNDARSYMIIGDPAVRLNLAEVEKTPTRASTS